MPTEPDQDKMTIDERRKYLKLMCPRYLKADRAGRSQLLTEMQHVTGMHRFSLVRLLKSPTLSRKKRGAQRTRSYGLDVQRVVGIVWESLDYICAQRLTPALLSTAQQLASFGELGEISLTPALGVQLDCISRSTVQRITQQIRVRSPHSTRPLPRKGPQQANQATKGVPMGRMPWQTQEPGHFEVDLVHHCGEVAEGEYLHTMQMVDVATGWSERVAVLGRGQRAMEAGFRHILGRVPFSIKELHPDNGSEFFNDHMIRFWGEAIAGLKLSRSRPYQKNDNRLVEQKNDTLVRAYLGAVRLEGGYQARKVNELYELMWVYYNLFQPVLHLKEKVVSAGIEGGTGSTGSTGSTSKFTRKWDQARTPYQRLVASGVLSEGQKVRLDTLYKQTNPRQLRGEIYRRLSEVWDWQAEQPGSEKTQTAA
jgi:hypothetical protein